MKKLTLLGIFILASACNTEKPSATDYKQKLAGNSAAATPATGDATKGKALLTSNCAGCHGDGKDAVPLTATEAKGIKSYLDGTSPDPGDGGAHGDPLNKTIKTSGLDLIAALSSSTQAPDAAKGQAYLTANCENCHKTGGSGHAFTKADSAKVAGAGFAAIGAHSSFLTAVTSNLADIQAALNAK